MAENETSSSNIEPKGDVKKLIRIRGGHKGAFTKSELRSHPSKATSDISWDHERRKLVSGQLASCHLA